VALGTIHAGQASMTNMTRRWFLLAALTLIVFGVTWLVTGGRVSYFTLSRRSMIEVNGTPVPGEILRNQFSAIVTRRDAGKKHSYFLSFEGDVDSTGDMGSVVDCHEWVAPHLPILLETRTYPPCGRLPEDGPAGQRWSLTLRGHSMQFVAKDHSTISVLMPE
jgi:hypothetical protein